MMQRYIEDAKKRFYGSATSAWIRVAAPTFLGTLIIWLIIHIIYFAGPRESLAARIETEILRQTLKNTFTKNQVSSERVLTFSVSSPDLAILEASPSNRLRDAHIKEYANVVEFVSSHDPTWIVVSWLTHAHPLTPEYLSPLTSIIDKLGIRDRTTLAVNMSALDALDVDFLKRYNIVEARDCYHEINIHCTYSEDWTWMPQQVMSRFLKKPGSWVASTNLPHHLPNLILNLPEASAISNFNFLDARSPVVAALPKKAIVFIGNNSEQQVMFRDNKEVLQRTYTAKSQSRRTLQSDGTPWHIFWAQMASMFIDDHTVRVAPEWLIILFCISLVLTVFLLGFKMAERVLFACLILMAFILLFANLLSVTLLNLYIPITPLIITSFATLAGTVFLRLSINSYRGWRLLAQSAHAGEFWDVKQNFLQLISHNLNTPIAQLRGLLELICLDSPGNRSLARALLLSDYVRISARAVLATSTLGNQPTVMRKHSPKDLFDNLIDDESSYLARLGAFVISSNESDPNYESQWKNSIVFDPDLFYNALLFGITALASRHGSSHISVDIPRTNLSSQGDDCISVTIKLDHSEGQAIPEQRHEFMIQATERFLETASSKGLIQLTLNSTAIMFSVKTCT